MSLYDGNCGNNSHFKVNKNKVKYPGVRLIGLN